MEAININEIKRLDLKTELKLLKKINKFMDTEENIYTEEEVLKVEGLNVNHYRLKQIYSKLRIRAGTILKHKYKQEYKQILKRLLKREYNKIRRLKK